tara:strand:+ start:207 stop:401 length:195 start_codon:yes stop_codon:yes gene_type:complete
MEQDEFERNSMQVKVFPTFEVSLPLAGVLNALVQWINGLDNALYGFSFTIFDPSKKLNVFVAFP